jgi:hypothetical protein
VAWVVGGLPTPPRPRLTAVGPAPGRPGWAPARRAVRDGVPASSWTPYAARCVRLRNVLTRTSRARPGGQVGRVDPARGPRLHPAAGGGRARPTASESAPATRAARPATHLGASVPLCVPDSDGCRSRWWRICCWERTAAPLFSCKFCPPRTVASRFDPPPLDTQPVTLKTRTVVTRDSDGANPSVEGNRGKGSQVSTEQSDVGCGNSGLPPTGPAVCLRAWIRLRSQGGSAAALGKLQRAAVDSELGPVPADCGQEAPRHGGMTGSVQC